MSLSFRTSPFNADPKRESLLIRFLLQKSAIFSRGSSILDLLRILKPSYFGHLLNSPMAAVKITVMVAVTHWRSCLYGKGRNTIQNAEYTRMFRF